VARCGVGVLRGVRRRWQRRASRNADTYSCS
jgi:hypothetical protein